MAGASVLTRAKLLEAATFKEGDVRVQVVELLGAGRGDVEKLHTHKTKSAHYENGAKNCTFRLHHTTLHSPRHEGPPHSLVPMPHMTHSQSPFFAAFRRCARGQRRPTAKTTATQ